MNYKTDKIAHGLIAEYEKLFSDIRYQAKNILEVGIYQGGSLLWMRDFFPNAKINGVDISLPGMADVERMSLIQADQADKVALKTLGDNFGPFDIIIDDGCHRAEETKITFEGLWPHLRPGGLYCIEDFIAGYWGIPEYAGMEKLVADIATRKKELGIKNYTIVLKEPKCSIACYEKN